MCNFGWGPHHNQTNNWKPYVHYVPDMHHVNYVHYVCYIHYVCFMHYVCYMYYVCYVLVCKKMTRFWLFEAPQQIIST